MFWEVLWALRLGFALSTVLQVFVGKERMTREFGTTNFHSVALATLFGGASSSCSYAAVTAARTAFKKGESLVPPLSTLFIKRCPIMETLVRLMTTDDAADVAALSEQLGYSTTAAQVRERLNFISRNTDNASFVAERGGVVLAWVNVLGVHMLASSASFAEGGGLVVHSDERRQGVGRLLMERAEAWAAAHGYQTVRLRSGLHRTDAHQFYQSIDRLHARQNLTYVPQGLSAAGQ